MSKNTSQRDTPPTRCAARQGAILTLALQSLLTVKRENAKPWPCVVGPVDLELDHLEPLPH